MLNPPELLLQQLQVLLFLALLLEQCIQQVAKDEDSFVEPTQSGMLARDQPLGLHSDVVKVRKQTIGKPYWHGR